jgi:hypothetical protein
MTITVRGGILLTAGFGLGYAVALRDSTQIAEAINGLKDSIDDLTKELKYKDVIEGQAYEIPPPPERKDKSQPQEETPKESQPT